MFIPNDEIRQVVARAFRGKKALGKRALYHILYRILGEMGIDIGGKKTRREGMIVAYNHILALMVWEWDGYKLIPLKPGMQLEILQDDYMQPYLAATVEAVQDDKAEFRVRIAGKDIDVETTPVIGRYARLSLAYSLTDPPSYRLSESADVRQLEVRRDSRE